MYTVFEVEGRKGGAKSYIVKEINEVLQIDYQKDKKKGEKIIFDKVTMHKGEVGRPYCNNVQVVVEVVRELRKDKKIIVFKKKAKKRYEVKKGHRQPYTWVKIVDITRSNQNS
jgi:large subunit ribosomal protein L21